MVRLVLCILLLTIVACAFGQNGFTIVAGYPNGGTVTGGGHLGGTGTDTYGGGSSLTITGPFNFEWQWAGSGPPPSTVILEVNAYASWAGTPGGSCNDGFSDGPGSGFTSGSSSGIHYLLMSVTSGGILSYTIFPTANVSGGGVTAGVTASPTSINMTILGPPSGTNNLDVGQGWQATVNVGSWSAPSDTFSWSTPSPGNPFANYQASQSSAVYTPFQLPSSPSTNSISGYFAGPPATCAFQCVYNSASTGLQFTLTGNINLEGPTISPQGTALCSSTMQILCDFLSKTKPVELYPYMNEQPDAYLLWSVTEFDDTFGVIKRDVVQDPPMVPSGSGQWAYVQTCNDALPTPQSGLDANFPFPFPTGLPAPFQPADGLHYYTYEDAPGILPPSNESYLSATTYPFASKWSSTHSLYIFYLPPNGTAGPSVYVPIQLSAFQVNGELDQESATSPWTSKPGTCGWTAQGTAYPQPFPQWTMCISQRST